ncbi:hypothetical protein M4R22_08135 [Acidovorax sp. GBBC 3334]|uniref:hypothetical protein n=1 Tax=Acidovorax sp. GBBC 3334 TaxID=2940496 RepID=UPI002303B31C|nr:hypothetical protein [Acidovorax sp. GBBC 3334]MDA8454729.1 hypothetical protein [Acidovorax sp. GBBC 3334]
MPARKYSGVPRRTQRAAGPAPGGGVPPLARAAAEDKEDGDRGKDAAESPERDADREAMAMEA